MTNQTPAQTTNGTNTEKRAELTARHEQPLEPLYTLRHAMNRLFDDFTFGLNMPALFEKTSHQYMPRVNVAETETAVIVTAELPGMDLKDIEVKLLGNNLVVKGEKKEEKEEKSAGYHRVERTYGAFERVLPLPPTVKQEQIDAIYKDGVLKVTLPKTEDAIKASKTIEVKGQ